MLKEQYLYLYLIFFFRVTMGTLNVGVSYIKTPLGQQTMRVDHIAGVRYNKSN